MEDYLENYNTMSKEDKIRTLEFEIANNEYWLELERGRIDPIKIKSRERILKWCKNELKRLINK